MARRQRKDYRAGYLHALRLLLCRIQKTSSGKTATVGERPGRGGEVAENTSGKLGGAIWPRLGRSGPGTLRFTGQLDGPARGRDPPLFRRSHLSYALPVRWSPEVVAPFTADRGQGRGHCPGHTELQGPGRGLDTSFQRRCIRFIEK